MLIKHYRPKLNNMLSSSPLQLFDGELSFFCEIYYITPSVFSYISFQLCLSVTIFLAVPSIHNSCENFVVLYTLLRIGIVLPETFNKCYPFYWCSYFFRCVRLSSFRHRFKSKMVWIVGVLLCSYAACCDFLQQNNLLSIIRAHEAQDAGWVKTYLVHVNVVLTASRYIYEVTMSIHVTTTSSTWL